VVPSFHDPFQSGEEEKIWLSEIWAVGWVGKLCDAMFGKEVHDSKGGVAQRIVVMELP